MEKFLKKNWFKLVILFLVLLATISVFYYYIFFLPRYEQATLNQQKQTASQDTQDKQDAQTAEFRKECQATNDQTATQYTDFLNTCTLYNSYTYCSNSEAGKMFQTQLNIPIEKCITTKQSQYYQ